MDPLSSFSTAKKLISLGTSAVSLSQKEDLLRAFHIETDSHSLLMLEMLVGALRQHDREQGKKSQWYEAIVDESLPVASRYEALSGLKDTFLNLLRTTHDPMLGNKMLATAVAGLASLAYPMELQARVLRIVSQLVPSDVDLLVRYTTQGVGYWRLSPEGEEIIFSRHVVQKNYVLRFMLDGGVLSEPLDSFAYNALKHYDLITDYPLPEPGPARRPSHYPGGPPPPQHEPFRLEWRATIFGKMIIEAFTGYSLRQILESEVGPPRPS